MPVADYYKVTECKTAMDEAIERVQKRRIIRATKLLVRLRESGVTVKLKDGQPVAYGLKEIDWAEEALLELRMFRDVIVMILNVGEQDGKRERNNRQGPGDRGPGQDVIPFTGAHPGAARPGGPVPPGLV